MHVLYSFDKFMHVLFIPVMHIVFTCLDATHVNGLSYLLLGTFDMFSYTFMHDASWGMLDLGFA